MFRPVIMLLAAAALLVGCDDADIRDVGRLEFVTAKTLIRENAAGSLQVEIHGAPWPGAAPAEIAGTLRMPDGPARELRFRAVAPGDPVIGDGTRLVLLFNPAGTTNRAAACRTKSEVPTAPPGSNGFTVAATFCRGAQWAVHGVMKARAGNADWLAYYLAMEKLLGQMFPNR